MSIIKTLVIDDDPAMTRLIEFFLKKDAFKVYKAHSGKEGIEAARRLDFDVIILDLMMPGIDGWGVCKEIRTFSQVPILVLSVIAKSEQVTRSLNEGANVYLTKPITKKALISHLKKLVENTRIDS